jgi:UV excision repair protein RAD23
LQVTAVKKQIEESQGKESFPCSQQLLIHQGKVLKDDTSMEDNTVSENGFLVVMLTKAKAPAAAATPSSSRTVEVSAEDLHPTPTSSPVGTASATNPASSPSVYSLLLAFC